MVPETGCVASKMRLEKDKAQVNTGFLNHNTTMNEWAGDCTATSLEIHAVQLNTEVLGIQSMAMVGVN